MPQPTLGQVHQVAALDMVAVAYMNEEYTLIDAAPVIPVKKESDVIFVWAKGAFMSNDAEAVRPGGNAPRGGPGLGTNITYNTQCLKWAHEVPDRVRDNADTPIRALVDGVNISMDKILLAREQMIATLLTTVANWTATRIGAGDGGTLAIVGGSEWNTPAGLPIDNMQLARRAVRESCFRRANTGACSEETADALMNNDQIIGRVRNTIVDRPVIVDMRAIEACLRIPKILVCSAFRNSAAEGQTVTPAAVFTDTFWVGYVAPSPSIMAPSALYTVQVKTPSTRTWYEDSPEQNVTESQVNTVSLVTAADAGFTITNTLG